MKKTFLFALLMTILMMNANATIRRVGFFANQIPNQDYTSLQEAHDAANTGDTLLIFPGSWSANYSKKLVTIGYGYFVSGEGANPNLQTITGSLSVDVYLYAESTGSSFEGFGRYWYSSANQ